jgi:hypothetical protein
LTDNDRGPHGLGKRSRYPDLVLTPEYLDQDGNSRRGDEGSVIPLILGFFLVAMLFVAGAVALSNVFTKQRGLQSICDGAAIYAAGVARTEVLHGGGVVGAAIPLADASDAVRIYLARDAARATVVASPTVAADGVTVNVTCAQTNRVAFETVILRPHGVRQTAYSSARSPLRP